MSTKHFIIISIIILASVSLGWLGRPFVESRLAVTETEVPSDTKIYQGFDFSFEYPSSFTVSEKGLWSAGRYEFSLNPPKNTDLVGLPDVVLVNESFDGTAQEFLEKEFSTKVVDWPKNINDYEFVQATIDGETYWKMRMYEMLDKTEYVKQKGTRIVGFRTYFSDDPETSVVEGGITEAQILEMLKSLKFE